jgi:rhodanese-related sulfurtransferase/predicted metal-dependent enzyme (double-stranded beta helix superfamily)
MTTVSIATLGDRAHDRFPPPIADDAAARLGNVARHLAHAREGWIGRVHHDPRRRYFERIHVDRDLDAWVIGWAPGQGVPAHEHGGSVGALLVIEGSLLETRFDGDGAPRVEMRRVNDLATVPSGTVHALSNIHDRVATTIHVYSPALRSMDFVDLDRPGAPRLRTEEVAARARSHPAGIHGVLREARLRLLRRDPAQAFDAWRDGALLVDIRPEVDRRREGVIPGALVIDRNVLEWRLDPGSPDRMSEVQGHDQEIVLVCNEGYASSLAATQLHDIGLANATDVVGGFRAWRRAGLPVVSRTV